MLSRDIDDVQLSASTEFGGLLTLGLDYTMLEWEQVSMDRDPDIDDA